MAVTFDNVSVSLYGKACRVDVLKGFNLQVADKEFVALTGPSGSGKSTVLNVVAGAVKIMQGEVSVLGKSIAGMTENELADLRGQIGFVFQSYYLFPRLPVWYNVAVPLLLRGEKKRLAKARAEELLTSLQIGDKVNSYPPELSGGEQQRVAIARALANDPPLILADEPTGNLDEENSLVVQEILVQLHSEGRTIIVATHDQDFAQRAERSIKL